MKGRIAQPIRLFGLALLCLTLLVILAACAGSEGAEGPPRASGIGPD